jgi:HEPN domain-containing protein
LVDSKRYREWFDMARKDLKGARILYDHQADLYLVCFHCQQAIEKYFKGFLILKTGLLQEGHSLIKLCKEAQKHDDQFKVFLKDCAFVNTFYIETRYPAEDPLVVSTEETLECLKITEMIIQYIDNIVTKM